MIHTPGTGFSYLFCFLSTCGHLLPLDILTRPMIHSLSNPLFLQLSTCIYTFYKHFGFIHYRTVMSALLKLGAHIDALDQNGYTALLSAVDAQEEELVDVLLKVRSHIFSLTRKASPLTAKLYPPPHLASHDNAICPARFLSTQTFKVNL